MRYKILPLLAALPLIMAPSPAYAQAKFENLDRLDGLVAMTVGANVGEPGGAIAPIDRRLKLAPCPAEPVIEGPVFGAAIVRCVATGWRIRVPLASGGAAAAQPVAAMRMGRPQASSAITVKRGDPVRLVAGGASFTVSRMMVADEDGAIGDMIRVREDRKAAPVIAQVVDMGIVRAPGFNGN